MILKRIKVNTGFGDDTNCYIVADEEKKEAMVIDPGSEAEKIIEMIDTLNATVKYIVLTHCHGDHIGALEELKKQKGGKVLMHRKEKKGLNDSSINLTNILGINQPNVEVDSILDDNDLIHIGNLEFRVIYTPGHTEGGISLYNDKEKLLFSGDTLFRGAWGRTDLPTSNFQDIINSITNKIMILPEDTIVYPGHRKINDNKRRRKHIFWIKAKRIK